MMHQCCTTVMMARLCVVGDGEAVDKNGTNIADGSDSDSGFEMLPPVSASELGEASSHFAAGAASSKRKREADGAASPQPSTKRRAEGPKGTDSNDRPGSATALAQVVSDAVGQTVELADGIGAPLAASDDDDVIVLDE